jgi:carboxyl-terminal processing protease
MRGIIKLVIILAIAFGGCAGYHAGFHSSDPEEIYDHAVSLIESKYVDDSGKHVNLDTTKRPDLSSLIQQLDSTAKLVYPDDVIIVKDNKTVGLGFSFKKKGNIVEIQKIVPNSPSQKAHIQYGDRLLEINNIQVEGLTESQIVKTLRGEKGSDVLLKIESKSGYIREITLTRDVVKLDHTISISLLSESIGYVRIDTFRFGTSQDVTKAVKSLIKKNMKALVLDLRNNDGGILQEVVEIGQIFLKEGEPVTDLHPEVEDQSFLIKSRRGAHFIDFPLAVLIDGQTGSGAEILAAALQDNHRAIVIGEQSAGKCDITGTFDVGDGRIISFRIANAHRTSGEKINGYGIKPDREIRLSNDERSGLYERISTMSPEIIYDSSDPQLRTAVDILLKGT